MALLPTYVIRGWVLLAVGIVSLYQIGVHGMDIYKPFDQKNRKAMAALGIVMMVFVAAAMFLTMGKVGVDGYFVQASDIKVSEKAKKAAGLVQFASEKIDTLSAEYRNATSEAEKTELQAKITEAEVIKQKGMEECMMEAENITGTKAYPADPLVVKCLQDAYPVDAYDAEAFYKESYGMDTVLLKTNTSDDSTGDIGYTNQTNTN